MTVHRSGSKQYIHIIREAVVLAANRAGGSKGLVGYLEKQARENPVAFMGLLGKAMPLQLKDTDEGGRVIVEIVRHAEQKLVEAKPAITPAPSYIEHAAANGHDKLTPDEALAELTAISKAAKAARDAT